MTNFIVNVADLTKILEQIRISERHAAGESLVDIIGADASLLPMGLRTVDGSYNNLLPGQQLVGSADQTFPHLLTQDYLNDADGDTFVPGPGAPVISNNNYGTPGSVADADPRIISNLIVDQTLNNLSALSAALTLAGAADPTGEAMAIQAARDGLVPLADALTAAIGQENGYEDALASANTVQDQLDLATTGLTALRDGLVDGTLDAADIAAIGDAVTAANAAVTAAAQLVLSVQSVPSPDAGHIASAEALLAAAQGYAAQVLGIQTAVLDGDVSLGDALSIQPAIDAGAALSSGAAATEITSLTTAESSAETARINANTALTTAQTNLVNSVTNAGLHISSDGSISIEHRSADIGLSPPNSGWMTLFGQFFDHGLDLVTKGGNGTVYMPLQTDDPLYDFGADGVVSADDGAGADGTFGTSDDSLNFMALTRATPINGTETQNTTTPFVDQNQTYTSHSSHQAFLREYVRVGDTTSATGKLMEGANGGIANWAEVKANALDNLGIVLSDFDVHDVPLLRTDAYGKFIPGANGYAQMITGAGTDGILNTDDDDVIEGSAAGVAASAAVLRTGHAFLNDIAHHAAPSMVDHDHNPLTPRIAQVADSDPGTGDDGNPLTYDDEMLNAHFVTGDGRGNENIGLTAVHFIFHAEHNRLVDENKATILASGDLAFINEWLAVDLPADALLPDPNDRAAIDAFAGSLVWEGERLFQAARFVTEMQYQHLVFEEFARRVQPNIDPFIFTNSADLDPAILAEFAHAVYRFGHSMLTDTVDRLENDLTTVNGDAGQIGLIEAFLNPIEFSASGVDDAAAAEVIIRGMSRQVGNEIDEFIVESLRNNLVGLPLDLAALNIARGRETGIPTLNDARAELYAMTGDAQVKPYTNWLDFAQNIKNPLSVVNFIAAYGTHASITGAATLEAKRDAAWALVTGQGFAGTEEERLAFLNGDPEASGVNAIDMWIGGLAEEIMEFGGQLGSTFNFIFEYQLEHLQNGDRFYYLSRTQGMNLLNQLEANTFTDIIMRNTALSGLHSTHLVAEIMEVPDMIIELDPLVAQEDYNGALAGNDPVWDDTFKQLIDPKVVKVLGAIRLDPLTGLPVLDAEGQVIRDGNLLKFSGGEHVVLGGTEGNDRIIGDKGIDTLWGDGGDDYLNAGMESDQVFGGDGDDIIEDPFGDDFLRGEAGNDVIVNGHGLDLLFGGTGNDFLMAVTDTTEVFAGEGDDWILGGSAPDVLLGNEGNDWIEGGEGFDGLSGENSELFFNSPIVGHDILNGQGNDTDYDAENGDDIMFQGAGIQRNNGMEGFDWAIHKGDPNGADSDLGIRPFDTRQALILRDRFDSVEGLSGWNNDDILTGAATLLDGEGFIDVLTQEGVDRIHGLRQVLNAAPGAPGDTVFEADLNGGGEIILGGAGSDRITGNLGNDYLDGDVWLNVRISVHQNKNGTGAEIATFDGLTTQNTWTGSGLPASWQLIVNNVPTGLTKPLHQLMREGLVNPGQLEAVREILNSDGTRVEDVGIRNDGTVVAGVFNGDVDVAVFQDVISNYEIETVETDPGVFVFGDGNGDGFITVTHLPSIAVGGGGGGNRIADGVDNIRNFEILQFADAVEIIQEGLTNSPATGNLRISVANGALGDPLVLETGDTLTVDLGDPLNGGVVDGDGLPPITQIEFVWQVEQTPGLGDWVALEDPVTEAPITGRTFTPTDLFELDGLRLRVVATFIDAHGVPEIVTSLPTDPITGAAGLAPVPLDPVADFGAIDEDTGTILIDVVTLRGGVFDPDTPVELLDFTDFVVRQRDGDPIAGEIINILLDGNNRFLSAEFQPAANFNGGVVVEFNVTDGVNIAPAELTLSINPVDDVPVPDTVPLAAIEVTQSTLIDQAALIGLTQDPDGDGLTAQNLVLADPAAGILTDNGDGTWTFQPDAAFLGAVTFNFEITDGITPVAASTSLDILNTAPEGLLLIDDTVSESAAGAVVGELAVIDPNVGQGHTFVITNALGDPEPRFEVVTIAGQYMLKLAAGVELDFETEPFVDLLIEVVDAAGAPAIANPYLITVNVQDVADGGPVVLGPALLNPVNEDTSIIITADQLLAQISDPNNTNDQLTIVNISVAAGSLGSIVDLGNRTFRFTPAADDDTSAVITFQVTDGVYTSEVAEAIIDILPDNDFFLPAGGGTFNGTAANEIVFGSNNADIIIGGGGDDQITGNGGTDQITTGTGNDIINDGAGGDSVDAGGGNDLVFASAGNDSLAGGGGIDTLSAAGVTGFVRIELNNNRASGAAIGNDVLSGFENAIGGTGNDTLFGDGQDNRLEGGGGNDRLFGNGGADILQGDGGNDLVNAGAGNDWIMAGAGDDDYRGDGGNDVYHAGSITSAINVNLAAGTATGTAIGNDRLTGIESVMGGSGNDTITGNNAGNILRGGIGGDTLSGGGGADALDGGTGADTMTGGTGTDRFVFAAGFGNDVVTDFDADGSDGAQDTLDISALGITTSTFGAHVLIEDIGADIRVTVDGTNTIRLANVANAGDITLSDFVLFAG